MPNYHYSAFSGPGNVYYSGVIHLDDYVETTDDYIMAQSEIQKHAGSTGAFVILSLTLLERPPDHDYLRYALTDAIAYLEDTGAPSLSTATENKKARTAYFKILKRLKRTV